MDFSKLPAGVKPAGQNGHVHASADPPCLKSALWALKSGLWPVPIHPCTAKVTSPGKAPIGVAWGKDRPDEASLRATFGHHPGAGVGLKLGAEGGIVDIDVDDPEHAVAVLARMFPEGIPATTGWTNAEGRFHLLFRWDDRFTRYGKSVIKGQVQADGEVTGNPHYAGLEIRIGAPPDSPKQLQTVIPPSPMANGEARRWNEHRKILAAPESLFADLDRYAPPEPDQTKAKATGPKAKSLDDVALSADALRFLGPAYYDDYGQWLNVGFALHSLGQTGLSLWDDWSRASGKYQAGACTAKWGSMDPGGITLGSLFHWAKGAGWRNPNGVNGSAGGKREPPEDVDQVDRLIVVDRWPKIDPAAFHGIAGEISGMIDPHAEADPAATLVQFLVGFANLVGRGPFFSVGATRHYLNLFCVLVGATASGRKGTSWDAAKWVLSLCDRQWGDDRIQSGLVSGEGLIHHVRDPETEARESNGKKPPEADPGVTDKRLLIVETELSRALKAMNRDGNTLSDVVRQAWDSGSLRTLGKHKASKATGAHISIIGHSTQADVAKHLTENDSANGFANRFLWVAVRRSKLLPSGGKFYSVDWAGVQRRMTEIVGHARDVREMNRSPVADEMWEAVYPELSEGKPGLLGAVTSRGIPQVLRLACVYALLDGTCTVGDNHLEAAVALWEYCEASARLVFGDSHGDPAADKLMAALRAAPEGLSRKQIFIDVFQKNKKSGAIARLLEDLLTHGLIHRRQVKTGGRPAEIWGAGRGGERVTPTY